MQCHSQWTGLWTEWYFYESVWFYFAFFLTIINFYERKENLSKQTHARTCTLDSQVHIFILARCSGGPGFDSCWGLIVFLCSIFTLVSCWSVHFWQLMMSHLLLNQIIFSLLQWNSINSKFTFTFKKGKTCWLL